MMIIIKGRWKEMSLKQWGRYKELVKGRSRLDILRFECIYIMGIRFISTHESNG